MVGTTLGHYKILRLLGAGGMGEVYAAEDLTLGRTVAVKILPSAVAASAADLDRFEREAKAVAALNHSGIVTLHSFEKAGDVRFITMELVEGEPLSARIPSAGLPFETLLRLGVEIADAISAAHDRGIVHRDLKPANVLVTADNHAKILDFGLAKLREPEGLIGDQQTRLLTGEGRIVGTVAYMSPEQAEGRPVDHRTDIFSLGILLYEMATGQRPFQGDTSLSVLSAVLKDQPRPATELNPALPSAFARILKTCLRKDPDRRYQSAKDIRNELQTLREELDSGELNRPAFAAATTPSRRWPIIAAGLAGIGMLALAAALWPRSPAAEPALAMQHLQLTSASGEELEPTLSPDGKWILYVSSAAGNADIYLQSVGGQTQINLTKDSPAADFQPAFSTDGERIAFRSDRDGGGLFVMGRTGEAPRRVATEGFDPAWSPDGKHLVYGTPTAPIATSRAGLSQLRRVQVDTGQVTKLTEEDAVNPAWSPNGRFIAYWDLGSGVRQLTTDAFYDRWPQWSPDSTVVAFYSNRSGKYEIWTTTPGGQLSQITDAKDVSVLSTVVT